MKQWGIIDRSDTALNSNVEAAEAHEHKRFGDLGKGVSRLSVGSNASRRATASSTCMIDV